jgi:glyoxylase-like metal-dependent hydrolase (beta-lactamase superfamily II)
VTATEVAPGIRRIPAPNPGPMTLDGTNTYVVETAGGVGADGARGVVVVDPGPLLEEHLAEVASYGPILAAVLTHRHDDHAGGIERFVAMTGVDVVLDRAELPDDGAELGLAGLRVFHTPGHTADSVCFVRDGVRDGVAQAGVVFTGDTILGRGTTVVAYPDGNLTDYLSSLPRIRDLGDLTVLPGHGPVLPSAREAASSYLAHRAVRLEQVRAAVAAGHTRAEDVVARVYADVDPILWPAAELSVRAQLAHLAGLAGPAGSEHTT